MIDHTPGDRTSVRQFLRRMRHRVVIEENLGTYLRYKKVKKMKYLAQKNGRYILLAGGT